MFGQALSEINMPIVLAIPPKIAANWFPNNELAQAVAISVFGDQLGIALSYLVPFVIKGPINSFLLPRTLFSTCSVVGSTLAFILDSSHC
jgi:hypothetical protein